MLRLFLYILRYRKSYATRYRNAIRRQTGRVFRIFVASNSVLSAVDRGCNVSDGQVRAFIPLPLPHRSAQKAFCPCFATSAAPIHALTLIACGARRPPLKGARSARATDTEARPDRHVARPFFSHRERPLLRLRAFPHRPSSPQRRTVASTSPWRSDALAHT